VSWLSEIEELRRRVELSRRMGGPERVQRQHDAGRLTVRERIDALLDKQSFGEIGALAGKAEYDDHGELVSFLPANCVIGRGTINARTVVVAGDDFTVRGGSSDAAIFEKIDYAERMAIELRLPLIRLIEGSGGGGSVRSIETTGRANMPGGLDHTGRLMLCGSTMSVVPVVSLGLGSVAGLGAARMVASHYSLMVKGMSAMFSAGPPVVSRLGEQRTKEELGGYKVQLAAGGIDDAVDSEMEAFEKVRQFLSYLPTSVWDLPPRMTSNDSVDRRDEALLTIVPRDPKLVFKIRNIINAIVDRGSFFEMAASFGASVVTGLARLDGWPVAVIAGDSFRFAGAWSAAAAQKLVRFIDMAETFHLPIVHLVDCPGVRVGLEAESSGVLRHAMRAVTAVNQTTVPWCSIIIRNVFGVGGAGHQPQNRLAVRYAWPSGRWGSLPLEGGVEAAYRAELDAAENPEAKLAEIHAHLERLRSPFRTAEAFWVEDIIDPRDTRPLLCEFANLAAPLRTPGLSRFGIRP